MVFEPGTARPILDHGASSIAVVICREVRRDISRKAWTLEAAIQIEEVMAAVVERVGQRPYALRSAASA